MKTLTEKIREMELHEKAIKIMLKRFQQIHKLEEQDVHAIISKICFDIETENPSYKGIREISEQMSDLTKDFLGEDMQPEFLENAEDEDEDEEFGFDINKIIDSEEPEVDENEKAKTMLLEAIRKAKLNGLI